MLLYLWAWTSFFLHIFSLMPKSWSLWLGISLEAGREHMISLYYLLTGVCQIPIGRLAVQGKLVPYKRLTTDEWGRQTNRVMQGRKSIAEP